MKTSISIAWLAFVLSVTAADVPAPVSHNASPNGDDRIAEVKARDGESPLARGERQLEQGDYEAAVESFTEAIQAHPTNAVAFDGRSQAYKELSSSLPDKSASDQAYLRHIADREKAAEILFHEEEMPGIIQDVQRFNMLILGALPVYLICWTLIAYLARRRNLPLWPVLLAFVISSMSAACLPLAAVAAIVVAILLGVAMYPQSGQPSDDDVAIDDDPRWSSG